VRAVLVLVASLLGGCVMMDDREQPMVVTCFLANCAGLADALKQHDPEHRKVFVTCIASRCSPPK
jgi:hypothetical protein